MRTHFFLYSIFHFYTKYQYYISVAEDESFDFLLIIYTAI